MHTFSIDPKVMYESNFLSKNERKYDGWMEGGCYTEHRHKLIFFVISFVIQQWSGFKKIPHKSSSFQKRLRCAGAKYKY